MTLDACYDALGLTGPCERRDVQRAYKRMVLRYHPDRCGDNPAAAVRFRLATEAYATLRAWHDGQSRGASMGACSRCGKLDRLLRGLHDRSYCPGCLLGSRRRLLPLPAYRTVKCAAVIALQSAAVVFFLRATTSGPLMSYAVAGIGCALASVLTLAFTLVHVDRIDS